MKMAKKATETEATEAPLCEFTVYDPRDEAYCHASKKGGPMNCPDADYAGKSYYPPCVRHWMKGKGQLENREIYNTQFRGK
jgi:hypothetical protein